jgi:anti-anti-sigma regulatory factor/HAMP domain-containing protein
MLVVLTTVAVVSVGITAAMSYRIARRSIEHQSFEYLIAVREMKANQIEDYIRLIADQAVTMAESSVIVEAMRDFRGAFRSMEQDGSVGDGLGEQDLRLYYQTEFFPRLESTGDAEGNLDDYWPRDQTARRLQKVYIHDNPFETGSKHLLDDARDGSTYSQAHLRYHPWIRNFLERFGYYDIFLIDHETGSIVYSVFKEVDFGTSLVDGPYWGSNLAEAFQSVRDAGRGKFSIVDFRPYAPSYGGQASFIATPIYDGDAVIGVLAFHMPVDRINDIMTSRQEWRRVGLGETGETYIVGDDLTLRNQSRFLIEDRENYLQTIKQLGVTFGTVRRIEALGSSIGLQEVRTEGTLAAVGGATGSGVFPDYRGVPVFSAYRKLDVPDLNWAIMSEIDRAEALAPVRAMRNRSLVLLAILVVMIVGVAVWFSGSLTRPIKRLAGAAAELAEGHLDRSVSVDGRDEIADLSRSFETMRKSLRTLVEQQEREIEALAVPLIPLREDVVAMPLMGELDARRLTRIRQTLVEGLHEVGAKAVLLDLTGIPVLSPESAEGLIAAARAARLLGVQVVLTGMQARVAADLADLDLHLEGIHTERSLESGIGAALDRVQGRYSRIDLEEEHGV